MKHSVEYERFTALVEQVLSVPKSVVNERLAEYRKQVDANPNRRGPKRKVKQPSVGHEASEKH
ncbi:MAG TPA: hypothetical protein VGN17_06880 [Bryobacteraceae bacterium]|jgi:hypothetical protein